MNPTLKRHLISAVVTFASAFLTTFGAVLVAIPAEQWTSAGMGSALAAAIFTAVRAALKVVIEKLVTSQANGEITDLR